MSEKVKTDLTLQKQKMWELAKKDFIKRIPKQYDLVLEGINDDSEYFHPKVIIKDNISVVSQCDISTDYVYGIGLKYKEYEFPLPADDWWEFAFCEDVHILVEKTYSAVKEYDTIVESINIVKSDLMSEAICKFADKEKLKKLSIKAFNIKEFIENKMIRNV